MIIYPMSNSKRHGRLVGQLYADIVTKHKELLEADKINPLQTEAALVYFGRVSKGDTLSLVDVGKIDDKDEFIEEAINELDYIQPDFMLFKNNPYWENRRQTRTAGFPDLIVEVWSPANSKDERAIKFGLYSSSDTTEHWHIEHDSNIVKCNKGTERLPNQNLRNILTTQDGIEFDLRYLALD